MLLAMDEVRSDVLVPANVGEVFMEKVASRPKFNWNIFLGGLPSCLDMQFWVKIII